MAGHSKWANIKRRKGAVDAKRGKIFSRLNKEIMVAARLGGGDSTGNPRLRSALAAAKAENMPKENVERAIKKGTGELEGAAYEEITYEGYGPGGVAVLVEAMTDNRVRTVAEVRHAFSKAGGNLGETNSVSWMFDKKGQVFIERQGLAEDDLLEMALEAGAEDMISDEQSFQILCDPGEFDQVSQALRERGLPVSEAAVTMIPKNLVEVSDEKTARQLLKMLEMLEDNDDVQQVHSNLDIADDLVEKLS